MPTGMWPGRLPTECVVAHRTGGDQLFYPRRSKNASTIRITPGFSLKPLARGVLAYKGAGDRPRTVRKALGPSQG